MNKLQILTILLVILTLLNIYLIISYNQMSFKQDISLGSTPGQIVVRNDDVVNKSKEVRIVFTGDVMLGRSVMSRSRQLADYLYPFRKTADRLKIADLTIINLENPIIENCPIHTEGFVFCSEPGSVSALEFAGVDIASIANNHAFDWGKDGIDQTIKYLQNAKIDSVGYENIIYKQIGDRKFAFIGLDYVSNPYEISFEQTELIRDAVLNSDTFIISVHWGNEYFSSANVHQRNMARKLIRLGADIIVGHHPHWIQDVECFIQEDNEFVVIKHIDAESFKKGESCSPGSKPVYYSLGNFVFDQMWSEETRTGVVIEVLFIDGKFSGQSVYNAYMQNWAQPEWTGNEI